MNHSYQIVTQAVEYSVADNRQFVVHVKNVTVEIAGERIAPVYPDTTFRGMTSADAMLKANESFQAWLTQFEHYQVATKD